MGKVASRAFSLALGLAVLVSCQLGTGAQASDDSLQENRSILLPPGSVLVAATLTLNVQYLYGGNPESPVAVNVHRVTAPWEENTVTWNSFAASYDPTIETTFYVSGSGSYAVDITGVVRAWLDGSVPNYGILLEQGIAPYTCYASGEHPVVARRPSLLLQYLSWDGTMASISLSEGEGTNDLPDAALWNDGGYWADKPMGIYDIEVLYSGRHTDPDTGTVIDKQSLIGFDLVATPETGHTYTIGYWKNHAGFGKQADMVSQYLPVLLGAVGGIRTMVIDTPAKAVAVLTMKTFGDPSNGITKLYAQLLAAKLSMAGGAGSAAIAIEIAAADAFLAAHGWQDWTGLSGDAKAMILAWTAKLDAYNNGIIGPGHGD